MTTDKLQQYRRQLNALRRRLQPDVTAIAESTREASNGQSSDLSNAPLHLGDMGTEEYLYELNTTLLENEDYLLGEVLAALDRIDSGSYGKCLGCGGQIIHERLEALPYVRYCVPCAEKIHDEPSVNLNQGRPRGPGDTLAPEGEMGESARRARSTVFSNDETRAAAHDSGGDQHAAGTAGGGTAVGGLAGTNLGHGDPQIANLEEATGSADFDRQEVDQDRDRPRSGRSGGAVGGTPANKRGK